jgi:hypothetical protein
MIKCMVEICSKLSIHCSKRLGSTTMKSSNAERPIPRPSGEQVCHGSRRTIPSSSTTGPTKDLALAAPVGCSSSRTHSGMQRTQTKDLSPNISWPNALWIWTAISTCSMRPEAGVLESQYIWKPHCRLTVPQQHPTLRRSSATSLETGALSYQPDSVSNGTLPNCVQLLGRFSPRYYGLIRMTAIAPNDNLLQDTVNDVNNQTRVFAHQMCSANLNINQISVPN